MNADDSHDDAPSSLEGEEPLEERGVQNPRIVDLVTTDAERGEVVLKMLEGRPWGLDPAQMGQLEDKLNSYFVYVLDGHLAKQYPEYEGMPVRIQLECVEPPREEDRAGFVNVATIAELEGLRFEVRVVADPFRHKAPWEG
jgi:hypothetical protein